MSQTVNAARKTHAFATARVYATHDLFVALFTAHYPALAAVTSNFQRDADALGTLLESLPSESVTDLRILDTAQRRGMKELATRVDPDVLSSVCHDIRMSQGRLDFAVLLNTFRVHHDQDVLGARHEDRALAAFRDARVQRALAHGATRSPRAVLRRRLGTALFDAIFPRDDPSVWQYAAAMARAAALVGERPVSDTRSAPAVLVLHKESMQRVLRALGEANVENQTHTPRRPSRSRARDSSPALDARRLVF